MRTITLFISAVIIGLSAGCSINPLGIHDAEWETMTTEQRMVARERQAVLDKARIEQRTAQLLAQREREAEAVAEQERLRQSALPGDRVQCIIENGTAYINRNWRAINPVAFELVRGTTTQFTMTDTGKRRFSYGYASFDGVNIQLCNTQDSNSCTTISGTTRQFQQGVSVTVSVDRMVRGLMRCETPDALPRYRRRM